ncbi:MAG TPA: thiamine pyrophosphate-dependent enzyme [Acidimicrobiia bacterium]|nr:thiamine pyrophosphate-dependent enzyme [Acidimicrobiia bacterium]
MSTKIASEILVERLIAWGVDTVFGIPGDGVNGVMEALRRHADDLRFVLVHHEEAAAFMACAHAKSTGRLGVCVATSGPGGIHLLNGLYDAKLDHQPVLAITGMQSTSVLGTGFQQEVHLEHLFADVAEYNVTVTNPVSIAALTDFAVRTALARRTVSHMTIPVDLQEATELENPWEGGLGTSRAPKTAPIYITPPGTPRAGDLQRAADVLNAGSKVVMLVGQGARHARAEVIETATRLGAPIVKSLLGKDAVPDDHPLCIGGLGLLGTRPSEDVMDGCDTLFMVGTSFPYTAFLPEPGKVKCVQIDVDPVRAANRMPTDVPLVGDSRETLLALLPLIQEHGDRSFLAEAQDGMRSWFENMHALEDADRSPIQPQYLMHVLDELTADDAVMTCDSGTIATWAARHWTIRGAREFYLSGNLATMAPGLPYANAIQLAHPGRQVVAFGGDGGFAMLMAEFNTACRYGLPIKVVVCNNGLLGQILWEQMALGFPEFGVRWDQPFDFAPWADACGGKGVTVTEPAQLRDALASALRFDGPALVDVRVNPDEPPMPAKIQYGQAKGFLEAFLHGQGRRSTIASTLFRDKISQLTERIRS